MNRPSLILGAAIAFTLPPGAGGQEFALPTPEEYAQRAEEAERALLFATHEPLEMVLRTDISWIRDERSDEEEAEGMVILRGPDGAEVAVPVKVRARGNFRRDRSNCNFPPLRLNFAGKQVEGTVFEGQDKLKLVTPCHDSRDSYQTYVIQEYLVYRVLQLLTPASFRVRLVHITYEDPDGGYDTRSRTAFLLEDDDQMAARNRALVSEWEQFHPAAMYGEQASVVVLFQYMIGNTDFSLPMFHNALLLRDQEGRYLTIPYDFDWSGIVDARYAVPDPRLPISDVRQRIFRGYCRPDVDHDGLIDRFNAQRDAIRALYEGMPELEEGARKRALEYYDRFYEIINDSRKYDREIVRACLEAGG